MISQKNFFGVLLLSLFLALVSCGGGGSGSGNGGGTTDTTAPSGYSVSFELGNIDETNQSAVAFSVTGAEIGTTYNYAISAGAAELAGSGTVSASSFEISGLDLSSFPDGTVTLEFSLTDGAGNEGGTATDTVAKNTGPLTTLSGTVTFDFVPHKDPFLNQFGLDYAATEIRPVRGATVQILDASQSEVTSTKTDELGNYSVDLAPDQDVQVRVRVELVQEGTASWDFSVTDNTNGNAIYVLDGSLIALGSENQTRDLHAPSGWGFPGYTSERAAGPFAILDTLYQILEKFLEVDSDIQFPATEFRWSENNVPEDGDLSAGQITTSSYRSSGGSGNVYILGAEDIDTDEYDPHVIVHEWGHYFEDQLSRSDSIGGSHSIFDSLDMRVAFGEGWGNALSGMILDDPVYLDSFDTEQADAGGINVDLNEDPRTVQNPPLPLGWYSEFSAQSILYDLYDNTDDGDDSLSLGLSPIYQALTDPDYIEQGTLTSIFSFLEQMREEVPASTAGINDLAAAQDISGTGDEGAGETNDGGVTEVLPVYSSVDVNGPAVTVCSDNSLGEFNKLGNRNYVRVTLPSAGDYTFVAERVSGNLEADPEIVVVGPLGDQITGFTCGALETGTTETMGCGGLAAAEHVIEVSDVGNTDDLDTDTTGGAVCFDVSVTD